MDSRLENIAVNALEHFREGQLFAWIGDEERADREFYSCISIIDSIQGVVHPELSDLRVRAMEVPRRSDIAVLPKL